MLIELICWSTIKNTRMRLKIHPKIPIQPNIEPKFNGIIKNNNKYLLLDVKIPFRGENLNQK